MMTPKLKSYGRDIDERIPPPNAMPETDKGRLSEGTRAYENGKTTVNDPLGACEQTIHINLFFDGTNNNDNAKKNHDNK
ncbi:hypothetical protein ACIP1U_23430 [Cupriavidus sp. NPDC089707]|uniref:hypothetical protein n=1 Tax=Cupriavidus sp. NPDC089707 TaxID=3363963 RepID=UPI0037FF18E8